MRLFAAASISLAMAIAATPAAAQMSGSRAPAAGEAPAGGRLERLEQQITDLQGVVAAVETLAKNNSGGGTGYAAAAGGGASSEQIRQLSEQIADLTQRIERLEARSGEGGGGAPAPQAHVQAAGFGLWRFASQRFRGQAAASAIRSATGPGLFTQAAAGRNDGPASSRAGAKPCGSE